VEITPKVLRFDRYALDLARGCLRMGEQKLDLRPKTFQVLHYLVANAGRVVSKQELYRAIWPKVSVTDDSLVQCIRELRQKLADEDRQLIKTVSRRGYVLDVPISTDDVTLVQPSPPDTTNAVARSQRPTIAVLPFDNLSDDPAKDYFANGIVEEIITQLSRFSELFVIARNSSFQYKGKAVDVRQVGRELGVRYVLEGSVRSSADRVRIAAQLIDAHTGVHRWADRYDRALEDIFAVQDEVAGAIVGILAAHVNKAEVERTQLKPPANWEAYDYYMRATNSLASYFSSSKGSDLSEARRLFERSLSVDANYARAYAELARTYGAAWFDSSHEEFLVPATLERAFQLVRHALGLEPNLAQAHAQLGTLLAWTGQHDVSITEFRRAVDLNPNFSDWRFIAALALAGELDEAVRVGEAHMRLDPFYVPTTLAWLGLAYFQLRRYPEALLRLRECVVKAPNYRFGHVCLAATHAHSGQLEQAQAAAKEVLRISPRYTIEGTAKIVNPFGRTEHAAHFFSGLRMAGLPEK
jgi:adenylate cyclase